MQAIDAQRTVRITFSCAPDDIIYINGVIDSYGNLGLMRTLDRNGCLCALYSTEGVYKTVLRILRALQDEGVKIEIINTEQTESVEI